MTETYTLYINAYTPATIPMVRLARYMQNFAEMLGHEAAVHFEALKDGSTRLVTRIDHEDVPKIAAHLDQIKRGDGTPDTMNAQAAIDRLLAEDNATGFLYEGEDEGAKVIIFPGVTKPKPSIYGPFNQEGSLDGILISVSGADDTVHIQLQNGAIKHIGLITNRETARRLARHMYEPVRVFGTGRWLRDEAGNWVLRSFRVGPDFDVLKPEKLKDAIDKMRAIKGSDWKNMDDPIAALRALRDTGNGLH